MTLTRMGWVWWFFISYSIWHNISGVAIKLMIFQFLPFYVVLMITLTKLQLFDCLIHEVMQCECHLQYATGSLMLYVVCWISLFRTSIFTQITAKEPSLESMCNCNPLSPNIHIQILQTDLHTFPLRISWENLIKDHGIFSMMIILLILITLSLDSVWILLGETCCWSLLALRGLTSFVTLWGLNIL